MDNQELEHLVKHPQESAKLDFKIRLYKLYEPKPTDPVEVKKWGTEKEQQWAEFVKDILALVNGNIGTVQQTAYLIIGADDKLRQDGTANLQDVGDKTPTRKEVYEKVNSYCQPRLPDLQCDIVSIDGMRLLVISLPPSPYLHRLSKQLETPKKEFSPHTVLLRRGDGEEIYEASPEEQVAIQREKQALSSREASAKQCETIPVGGVSELEFFGRRQELEKLAQLFQHHNRLTIVTIIGMGGVGKTELAIQYARQHFRELGSESGGVCWIDAREGDAGIQLVRFAEAFLDLKLQKDWDIKTQLRFCWQNWPIGDWLIVIDDVTDYRQQVSQYLPSESSAFKLLLTAREAMGRPAQSLAIRELKAEDAQNLLRSLIGLERIELEQEATEELCKWLEYLPLGLELVGRYLEHDSDLSIQSMLCRLHQKGLKHQALVSADQYVMTAERGVAAAFELSWERLDEAAQQLGCLLSLFALADIPWNIVKLTYSNMSENTSEESQDFLGEARLDLLRFNLLQRTDQKVYRLHQLIREFFKEKLNSLEQSNDFRVWFVTSMLELTLKIPDYPSSQEVIPSLQIIPHIAEILKNENVKFIMKPEAITFPCIRLGIFYKNQGLLKQAEHWFKESLRLAHENFDGEHLEICNSLDNLGAIYHLQGNYKDAEILHKQALELYRKIVGEESPDVCKAYSNLGSIYHSQGRYSDAEPLFKSALAIGRKLDKSNLSLYLSNLGTLYHSQGRYSDAEPFLQESLKIKRLEGDSLEFAFSLTNLASLYESQAQHKKAESLYMEALEIRKNLLGEEHLDIAASLNYLANVYESQSRFREAEVYYNESLRIRQKFLGESHPDVATTLNNLGYLCISQKNYEEAEVLFDRSLKMREVLLEEHHIDIAQSLKNLSTVYVLRGQYTKAKKFLEKALFIYKKSFSSSHHEVVDCQEALKDINQFLLSKTERISRAQRRANQSKTKDRGFSRRNDKNPSHD